MIKSLDEAMRFAIAGLGITGITAEMVETSHNDLPRRTDEGSFAIDVDNVGQGLDSGDTFDDAVPWGPYWTSFVHVSIGVGERDGKAARQFLAEAIVAIRSLGSAAINEAVDGDDVRLMPDGQELIELSLVPQTRAEAIEAGVRTAAGLVVFSAATKLDPETFEET